ncbi:hypothetical protein [Fredinandcohnia quinoae]|uniref:Uncharacterized protein n=1 Tax=Fredinandcohnia quinoae TaxID=2918902 RepID=A0AAW5E7N8_9BACI|nr:hypothetical protein [Fredinandcohnia sp. SECRCQ15]MCH1627509.1 hypothetical protein [Fredinandcohnia sp. SECRCQ15]
MEMQTKDNLNYTSQLPKWAISCHIGLISIFLLLGMGMFVLTVIEVLETGLGFSILLFMIGVFFFGLSWFSYKNLRKYLDVIVKISVGEKGYDYYEKDKKRRIEHDIFLPYENMKYVLIGMDYRIGAKYKYSVHYDSVKLIPLRIAKILICGVSTQNRLEVLSFSHSTEKSLNKWLDVFRKQGVQIFHTDKALSATPNNPEAIELIPKERFEGTLSFVIGSEAEGLNDMFLTKKQQAFIEEKEKRSRKNGIYYTTLVAISQIIMICFWFPHWEIVDRSFGDSSGEYFALLFTIISQAIVYIKMRKIKWYEPIRDMIIIYIGILVGIKLSPDERTIFQSAVQGYAIMAIGAFLFLYYGIKIYSWFQRLGKK